jgi:4-hydroxyproline epimerase
MMSGSILYPPHDAANDIAVLFIETSGCLPMCGHGTLGTITIGIEYGLINPRQPGVVRLETPAGLVIAEYKTTRKGNKTKVTSVKLTNVPSFLAAENLAIDCCDLGKIHFDVAYGGNFYAIVDPQENFKGLENYHAEELIRIARDLRRRINDQYQFVHPLNPNINGCSHILWTGSVLDKNSTARNAVFYGEKAIDRSPCGTGTSARMAQWHAKGKLKKGEEFIHESIIGSKFIGRIEEEIPNAFGNGKSAIRPSIEGWARVFGENRITIDPDDDPYAEGFQVL